MHFTSSILISTVICFSATHGAPAPILPLAAAIAASQVANLDVDPIQPVEKVPDPGTGPINPDQLQCTNKGTPVPPELTNDPEWVNTMNTCLGKLNADGWSPPAGLESNPDLKCQPQKPDGTPLGKPYQFSSFAQNWDNPRNCFEKCQACLTGGVNNDCLYTAGDGNFCSMGFRETI
ncbi:MAG: hypothetical protein Q9216_001615 [Gyalolechia sp. 2 TL-2023]